MPIPKGPIFIVSKRPRCFDFQTEAETHSLGNRLGFIKGTGSVTLAFDPTGTVWSRSIESPQGGFSVIARVLAHTIYNPSCRLAINWTQVRSYDFDELRQHYLDAIADDDDVLTQFVERDELRSRVCKCATFADLVATWEWQETDSSFGEQSPER